MREKKTGRIGGRELDEAVRPQVRMEDGRYWLWPIGDGGDGRRPGSDAHAARAEARGHSPKVEAGIDRRLRGLIPIYADEEGDYCRIPLTHGHFVKVDPEDYCWVSQFRWHYVRTGRTFYAVRSDYSGGRGRKIWLHREILGTPKGLVCDHINHNGLDDRKHNLRNCTVAQNNLNRQHYRNSRGRYKGVWWCKTMQMWGSEIQAFGEAQFLGYFVHEVQAARAYDAAARRLHGEFAFLNFPEEPAHPAGTSEVRNAIPETHAKHKGHKGGKRRTEESGRPESPSTHLRSDTPAV